MALTPLTNRAAVLEISSDGTTFTPLLGFQSNDEGNAGSTTTVTTLDGGSFSYAGQPNKTLTIAGLLDITDPGQVILRSAMMSGAVITFRKKYNGTDGYKRTVTVSGERRGAPQPEGYQTTSFDLAITGAAVAVGAGPVMP